MASSAVVVGVVVAAATLATATPGSAATTAGVTGTPGTAQGQTLTVTGGTGDDTITVGWSGNVGDPYVVTDPAGVTANAGCVVTPASPPAIVTEARCSRNGVPVGDFTNPFVVSVQGGDGDDLIRHTQDITYLASDVVNVDGGAGDDVLGGSRNADRIGGGPGDDLVDGGAGDDTLSGFSMPLGRPVTPDGSFPIVAATAAEAGTDTIYGGPGSDHMSDGDDDAVAGALNGDSLNGQWCQLPACAPLPPGIVDSIEDDDTVLWGQRTQPLTVDLRHTTGHGASGEGESIVEVEGIAAGSGNDKLTGTETGTVLRDDSLRGNGGDDVLVGLSGDDELLGGGGADTMFGGEGADAINPGGNGVLGSTVTNDGRDVVDGGPGRPAGLGGEPAANDVVVYTYRTDALVIDLTAGTGGAPGENDALANIEDVIGGHAGDTIIGTWGQQNLIAGDPLPFVTLPGELPNPPSPPGGSTGPDVINTRDDTADVVDCSGGIDTLIADRADAQINCEHVDVPPPPPPPLAVPNPDSSTGDRKGDGSSGRARRRSGRTVAVRRNGAFEIPFVPIVCPTGRTACRVTTIVTSKRSVRLGRQSYLQPPGTERAARSKLSRKGQRQLDKRGVLKAVVTILVSVGRQTSSREVTVTLKR